MHRFLLLLAVACSGTPSQAPATPTPTPSTKPEPVEKAGPSNGESCGTEDRCGAGLECVSYYGIAGARGPQFKTCEQKCEDDSACTGNRHCATIADGPGRVCR